MNNSSVKETFSSYHIKTILKCESEVCTGISPRVIEGFTNEFIIDTPADYEKNIALLFDEMHIKSGVIFSRSLGKLVSFTELGYINKELDEFKRNIDGDPKEPLATHIFLITLDVYMTCLHKINA